MERNLLPYFAHRNQLAVEDGLVLKDNRIVVPAQGRKRVLQQLHQAHLGVEATKRRAAQLYFWPGITSDIWNVVMSCPECARLSPTQPREPGDFRERPSRAFELTGADLFTYANKHFLIYTDMLTGWTEIDSWSRDPTSADVIVLSLIHI